MYRTNDPVADAERHIAELDRQLERRPKCERCGHHIQDDYFYRINGCIVCDECQISFCNENCKEKIED